MSGLAGRDLSQVHILSGAKWVGGLATLLGYERGESLISPFDLLYFQCKVQVLYIIYQYLF